MNKIKIAALIPMRHSSERVPGKNYRSFAGKPLFFHIVENLLKSKFVDEIVSCKGAVGYLQKLRFWRIFRL